MIVLDRKFHRVLVVNILDQDPFFSKYYRKLMFLKHNYPGISASHMLGLPISNLVVLSEMKIAGLVQTKSKKGELSKTF